MAGKDDKDGRGAECRRNDPMIGNVCIGNHGDTFPRVDSLGRGKC
jgi:hypothetical protein